MKKWLFKIGTLEELGSLEINVLINANTYLEAIEVGHQYVKDVFSDSSISVYVPSNQEKKISHVFASELRIDKKNYLWTLSELKEGEFRGKTQEAKSTLQINIGVGPPFKNE